MRILVVEDEADLAQAVVDHLRAAAHAVDHASTLDAAEAYASESGNVGYQARQIAREKARADAFLTRRKAENATRESAGLAPLPLDEVNKLFKIPAEPNRLESLLLLNQLDSAAQRLTETATVGTVQLNAARTGTA